MDFRNTHLRGICVIRTEPHVDGRGFFARTYCTNEFRNQGIDFRVVQCNVTSSRKGALRGFHYQRNPASEQKIVRCTRGAAYYLVVDIRNDSPTYLQSAGFELNSHDQQMLYVGPGFASGSQALEDDTEVSYMMTEAYDPAREGGYRYDDPAFQVSWPLPVTFLSRKDAAWPRFRAGVEVARTTESRVWL
jgi:dTDP-4-dehydrorhamnose 3,5-epimerase